MKPTLLTFSLIISMASSAFAEVVNPLPTVRANLESFFDNSAERKTFAQMKKLADDRNTDIDIAIENYLIAKKNVNVARAAFNPVSTGHMLGISLGLNYFWAPLAIDAVLSIPTKLYNVSKSKHLAQAQAHNLTDAKNTINNELAHLYYDILTHELILRSIDLEIDILTYQESKWLERELPESRVNDIRKWILRLGIERADIYSLYVGELAAIRTMVSNSNLDNYQLAQVKEAVQRSLYENLDKELLQSEALKRSPKYKSAISLEQAAAKNIKSVKWSIITFTGLRLSYKQEVREAKNEKRVAALRRESTAYGVKNNVLLELQNLESSLNVYDNYAAISDESLDIFTDTYELSQMGLISEDAVIETALSAIRDYRSKIVAHYSAWSALDDFSLSTTHYVPVNHAAITYVNDAEVVVVDESVEVEATEATEVEVAEEKEVEVKEEVKVLTSADFSISKTKTGMRSLVLAIGGEHLDEVAEVDYIFASKRHDNRSNNTRATNFRVTIKTFSSSDNVGGVALVNLKNGKQLRVNF